MEDKLKNDCTCKEKWTFGVVHLKDSPCYWPPNRIKELVEILEDMALEAQVEALADEE